MQKQRLRNLTTKKLHTEIDHVYKDLEFITGTPGIMTHQLPNILTAVEPWLKDKVKDPEYWDGEYNPALKGELELTPATAIERQAIMSRFAELPSLLFD